MVGTNGQGPERLRVYQLAQDVAHDVERIICSRVVTRSLADQLVRAADSVVLNIAEGAGHYSPGRKLYHYQTAHGSATECIAALTRLNRRTATPDVESARRTANMICVMLRALIRTQEDRKP